MRSTSSASRVTRAAVPPGAARSRGSAGAGREPRGLTPREASSEPARARSRVVQHTDDVARAAGVQVAFEPESEAADHADRAHVLAVDRVDEPRDAQAAERMLDERASGFGRIAAAPVRTPERVRELDLDPVEARVGLVLESDPRGDVVLKRRDPEQSRVVFADDGPEAEVVVRSLELAVDEPVADLLERPQAREP